MRLDKFLKVSRLIKRRTLAKQVCDQGRVTVNGASAKASKTVAPGDEITIRFGRKRVTVRVADLKEAPRKDQAADMYTLLEEQPADEGADRI